MELIAINADVLEIRCSIRAIQTMDFDLSPPRDKENDYKNM